MLIGKLNSPYSSLTETSKFPSLKKVGFVSILKVGVIDPSTYLKCVNPLTGEPLIAIRIMAKKNTVRIWG